MKTTIDIDTEKVKRLMNSTGLRTCRAVVDFALSEAERLSRINRLYRRALPNSAYRNALDPHYNLEDLRNREKP